MGRDWDKILAYETIKVVMIEDKCLGGLHWGLTGLIAVYVVIYVFLFEKGYLKYTDVKGIVYMNVKSPSNLSLDLEEYCTNDNTSTAAFNPKPCEVWSTYTLSATDDLSDSFFLATQVEYMYQTRDCTPFLNPSVQYRGCDVDWSHNGSLITYVGAAEKFKVSVTHNAFAPEYSHKEAANSFYYKGNSLVMDGDLVKSDETTTHLPKNVPNLLTLADLIASVSNTDVVRLDQKCTDFTCNRSLTFREVGIVLVLDLEYKNNYDIISPSPLRYTLSVSRMPDASYVMSTIQDVVGGALQSRTVRTLHGIRLDFIKSGEIGAVDLATIISVAIESVVLLKIAAVLVDLVATRIMSNRRAYTTMKYHRVDHNQVQIRKQKLRNGNPLTASLLAEDSGVINSANAMSS